ncbi:LCP family protein [Candidatus Saganbacteria bacterium]|nr:LCP family protein [Candidatus Saganbacteria bacterium]
MKRGHKPDFIRLLALVIVALAIIFFYLNAFIPRLIPKFTRFGIIRQPVTLLILGTDVDFDMVTKKEIGDINTRTDTIMVARFNPINNKIKLLSIPRDTYVNIPGFGFSKINAAHVYGGPNLTKQTVSELLNRPIDHYIEIQPEVVIELVDLLGGVNIEVEKDMSYVDRAQKLDINLRQGKQKLSGKLAHDYIRFRHDAMGDLGRVERQQKFLTALTRTLLRPANIIKSPLLLGAILKHVKTDLSPGLLFRLINYCRFIPLDKIAAQTAPGIPTTVPGAGSIIIPDKSALQKLVIPIMF